MGAAARHGRMRSLVVVKGDPPPNATLGFRTDITNGQVVAFGYHDLPAATPVIYLFLGRPASTRRHRANPVALIAEVSLPSIRRDAAE